MKQGMYSHGFIVVVVDVLVVEVTVVVVVAVVDEVVVEVVTDVALVLVVLVAVVVVLVVEGVVAFGDANQIVKKTIRTAPQTATPARNPKRHGCRAKMPSFPPLWLLEKAADLIFEVSLEAQSDLFVALVFSILSS